MATKSWTLACAGILAVGATAGMSTAAFAGASITTKYGKTTVSAKTYVDGSYIDSRADGHKNSSSGFGFNVKRFYLTFEQQFNEMFSARFRTDIESGDSASNNAYNVYVKNAWVQAKFSPGLALRAGVADLPWVPYVEDLYGFRYVEHVLIDRAHFGTSADLGLTAMGKLADGKIDYQLSVINGGGYHDVARSKTVDVAGRIGFHPNEHITLAVGAREGQLGSEQYDTGHSSNSRTATRYDAVAAWVSDDFRIGVEGFYAHDYSTSILTETAPSDQAYGASFWVSHTLPFNPKLTVFGRYDYVPPHTDTHASQHDNYFNVGLQYQPMEAFRLALVYKRDRIQGGATPYNASNIKAAAGKDHDARYDEIGVFAQYVF